MDAESRSAKPGWTAYLWFVAVCFLLYVYYNFAVRTEPFGLSKGVSTVTGLAEALLFGPVVSTAIFGGIRYLQSSGAAPDLRSLWGSLKKYTLPFLLIGLARDFLYILVAIAVSLVSRQNELTGGVLLVFVAANVPLAATTLFWAARVVGGDDLLGGLGNALRLLISNPYALLLGLGWGIAASLDNFFPELLPNADPIATGIARAGLLACIRIVAIDRALYLSALTPDANPVVPQPVQGGPADETAPPSARGLSNASLVLGIFSFVPLLHLLAMFLGLRAIRKTGRIGIRSGIGVAAGAFFTVVYYLLVFSWGMIGTTPPRSPGLGFLREANPSLALEVRLMEDGQHAQALPQLRTLAQAQPGEWTTACALAIAEWGANGPAQAMEEFSAAMRKRSTSAECYFFYGAALLENDQPDQAAQYFTAALNRSPNLAHARQGLELIETSYTPSRVVEGVLFLVILLLLFTVHEYGHAFAAWKLGDDTARNRGRLTLNPIPHLDIIGSLVLPVILFVQQADVIFGWAKPVPVDPGKFKDPRRDHMRVSFAGPGVNMLVAMACFVLLGLLMLAVRALWPASVSMNLVTPYAATALVGPPAARWIVYAVVFLKDLFFTSLVLGIFNLLPIPPLDGSWILSGLLPPGVSRAFEAMRRFSFVLLMLIVLTHVLDWILGVPLGIAWGALDALASVFGFS